jgi:hypothetical protein
MLLLLAPAAVGLAKHQLDQGRGEQQAKAGPDSGMETLLTQYPGQVTGVMGSSR